MVNFYIEALKVWNAGGEAWCIPRKGTEKQKEVKAIMEKAKNPNRRKLRKAPEEKEKTDKTETDKKPDTEMEDKPIEKAIKRKLRKAPEEKSDNKTEEKLKEEEKKRPKTIEEAIEHYSKIDGRKKTEKKQIENGIYNFVIKHAKNDEKKEKRMQKIFDKYKGIEKIFRKVETERKISGEQNKAYEANLKDIEKTLKVGDVILDEDYGEWVVTGLGKGDNVIIKKRNGKKEIEIEYSYRGQWEEVLEENDDGELPDRDPKLFDQMFIKV